MDFSDSPTLSEFFRDGESMVRVIVGPVGSGKTTACCFELYRRATEQEPDGEGVRRSRWLVVRNTFPELRTTTLKSWQRWFGSVGELNMTPPISHRIRAARRGGTRLDMEVVFMALDTEDDVGKVLSLEVTGAYVNECRFVPYPVIRQLALRVGRYPGVVTDSRGRQLYGPTWHGVIGDSNAPYQGEWLYEKMEKPDADMRIYVQPPAVHEVGWREAAACPG